MSHPTNPETPRRPKERPALADAVPIHDRLWWDLDDLEALTGISRRTWERWKSAGRLPRPIKIGRRVLWTAASIRRFLDELATGREVS